MAYVYGHYKKDTGELFYIGKGTGRRAWERSARNPHWNNVVNKHGLEVKILEDNLTDEGAFIREKKLIEEIGLDKLTNIREGGEGFTSEESRRLQLELNKDPEYKKKLSEGLRRKWSRTTEEERLRHKNKCRQAWIDASPEEKEKRIFRGEKNPMYSRTHSDSAREKMKKSRGPNPKLAGENNPAKRPDVRKKMSEARKRTPTVTCSDCGKTLDPQNFGKWHKGGKCRA